MPVAVELFGMIPFGNARKRFGFFQELVVMTQHGLPEKLVVLDAAFLFGMPLFDLAFGLVEGFAAEFAEEFEHFPGPFGKEVAEAAAHVAHIVLQAGVAFADEQGLHKNVIFQ
jgi:hypothetical protein